MNISIKSPTRVDLAGGTLDLWPLYCFVGGAVTVNLSIDIYTYANLEVSKDRAVYFDVVDLGYKISEGGSH